MNTIALAVLVLSCATAHAQSATPQAADWQFSAGVSAYVVPDGRNYVESVMTADRGWLHLEGGYNYEALRTGSVSRSFRSQISAGVPSWRLVLSCTTRSLVAGELTRRPRRSNSSQRNPILSDDIAYDMMQMCSARR
jgi:hypothetical protein